MKRLLNLNDSEIYFGFYGKYGKRFIDIMVSFIFLIIFSPLLVILCILVRIKLGSPVFFKQTRAGRDEIPFEMIKFRTMADKRDANGKLLPDEERFTKFGDFLRRTSLDELPEMFNVLKGDMSLVGPRPLYTFYLPYYTEEESLRHVIRGGITGLAQINGRALCHWNDRFAFDVAYVKNVTLINDMKIIWKTCEKVIRKTDIGIPSVTDEGGLHIVREVQRPDRLKEIGSGFSTTDAGKKNDNYPVFLKNRGGGEIVYFYSNCRNCIREILLNTPHENRVAVVPSFTCEAVIAPFILEGFEIYPYFVKETLCLDIESLEKVLIEKKPSVFLFHSYFGFDTNKNLPSIFKKIVDWDINVIEDRTQCMFSEFHSNWADFVVGSIRKWGPVPDGAFLWCKQKIFPEPMGEDKTYLRLITKAMDMKERYLKKRDIKKEDVLEKYEIARVYMDRQRNIYAMAQASRRFCREYDWEFMKDQRRKNFLVLAGGLNENQWMQLLFQNISERETPFYFPVLINSGRRKFQEYLAKHNVYATIIWACPTKLTRKIDSAGKNLYDKILCIPCDQRYDANDMRRIVALIQNYKWCGVRS